MPDLTFGEQVKIVLGRKGMTIKELAKVMEERTGKKMSRQNLTQRLGRDNFQEQDMRLMASILGCSFKLSILEEDTLEKQEETTEDEKGNDKYKIADGELIDKEITEEEKAVEEFTEEKVINEELTEEDAIVEELTEKDAIDEELTGEEIIDEELAEEETIDEEFTDEEIIDEGLADEEKALETGREITVGEFLDIKETSGESQQESLLKELLAEMDSIEREGQERERERIKRAQEREQVEELQVTEKKGGWMSHFFWKREEKIPEEIADMTEEMPDAEEEPEETTEDAEFFLVSPEAEETGLLEENEGIEEIEDIEDIEETESEGGEINPYTGDEYETNSVRMHPMRIGYVQVYSRKDHKWTDMTEWAFLGEQERKKLLLGKAYEPPVYLD